MGLSVERSRERNAFLSHLFSSPPFTIFPTLHLSFLTSEENGNRKMTKSFLFRVLFHFYSRRMSKRSNQRVQGWQRFRRDGWDCRRDSVVAEQLVFKVAYVMRWPWMWPHCDHSTSWSLNTLLLCSLSRLTGTKGVTKVLDNFQGGVGMEHRTNKLSVTVTSFVDNWVTNTTQSCRWHGAATAVLKSERQA